MILLTNRLHREVTLDLIEQAEAAEKTALLAGGVRVLTTNLHKICEIRTWSEMLFPIPGARMISLDEKKGASELAVYMVRFLKKVHGGKCRFPFSNRFKTEKR